MMTINEDCSFEDIYCIAKKIWDENDHHEVHIVELLRYYLQYYPDRTNARAMYGDSLGLIGRSDEAFPVLIQAFNECQQTEDKSQAAEEIALGIALLAERYKSPGEAKKWYEITANALTSPVGWIWLIRGINLAVLGEFKDSIECFEKVIQTQADEKDEALLNLGLVYRAMGKYNEAMDCFRQALDINASYKEAQNALRSLDGIHETINLIQQSKPEEVFLDDIYRIAREFWDKDREVHIAELMRHYLQFRPKHIQAWFMYGSALRILGNRDAAYSALKQAFENCQQQEPKGEIALELAKLTEKHFSPGGAKKWFEIAHELLPDFGCLWMYRGENLAVLGEFEQAIECYDNIVRMHNDLEDEALFKLGLVYRSMGKYDEAIDCLRQALDINPAYQELQEVLRGLEGIYDTIDLIEKSRIKNAGFCLDSS
ncbi:MAG: tetratricopeptide repeat protein [Peptococcaceae bacterium]|nr:tetratricopeptide repeat protein [Peptococcaceae bacterium]